MRSSHGTWGADLDHDASEIVPAELWGVFGVYLVWLFVFLFLAIDNKAITAEGADNAWIVYRALVGGVVPVLGAYAITSDKSWGQWYLPVSFGLLVVAAASIYFREGREIDALIVISPILFILVTAIVFVSPTVRKFYAAIRFNERLLK